MRECVEKLQELSSPAFRAAKLQARPEVSADPHMDPGYESDVNEMSPLQGNPDRGGLWHVREQWSGGVSRRGVWGGCGRRGVGGIDGDGRVIACSGWADVSGEGRSEQSMGERRWERRRRRGVGRFERGGVVVLPRQERRCGWSEIEVELGGDEPEQRLRSRWVRCRAQRREGRSRSRIELRCGGEDVRERRKG